MTNKKTWAYFQNRLLPSLLILIALLPLSSRDLLANTEGNQQLTKEFHIKALFLYNFANFVEWPTDAFKDAETPLRMCLYGSVPFGGFLDAVDGTRIRDRHLKIIRTSDPADIESGCHILFVGTNHLDTIEKLFKNMNHLFVLSIGNVKGFTDKGGIVNILRTQDQQKFDINLSKAIENGLLIDSDLLSLARIINRK
jgi:hypothetical protein